jgi:hypothetical protein
MMPPESLHGQLQRGRGLAARRGVPADLLLDCICTDPRDDRQTESRDWFYARLAVDSALPVEPIADHLFDAADAAGPDERVGLAVDVLVEMAGRGRTDAIPPLRRYVTVGRHWQLALDTMWECGDPLSVAGLESVVLARVDDDELRDLVDPLWGPWQAWSAAQPRIQAALDALPARQPDRPDAAQAKDEQLVDLARGRNVGALIELGRRGNLAVLDLAEELRLEFGLAGALRRLGAAALFRARDWVCGDNHVLASAAVTVLADHGDIRDAPVLLAALGQAAAEESWCETEDPARALGRLGVRDAAPLLRAIWSATTHSYARRDVLSGLLGTAASVDAYVDEALDDCEPQVRQLARQSGSGPDGQG